MMPESLRGGENIKRSRQSSLLKSSSRLHVRTTLSLCISRTCNTVTNISKICYTRLSFSEQFEQVLLSPVRPTEGTMTMFNPAGLVQGGRIGPQILGHQQPRLVVDDSHIDQEFDPSTNLWVCPLDRVFTHPQNPVIVFGVPNVALILPNEARDGWDRFAAFMFWRQASFIADTKGRVQAGIFFELSDAPAQAVTALREAIGTLEGTRKASCAHSVALALHRAGFSTGGKSPRWIYRPSRLASTLWRNGLEYRGQHIELRIIQTHSSVSDHFVWVWKREANSIPRLVRKYYANSQHGRAPVFEAASETIEMSDDLWNTTGTRANLGITVPSRLGTNLSYIFGEQPEFVVQLPQALDDPRLPETLKPFPGKLDRITWLKKNILFSRPVIWFMRKHLATRIDWIGAVPVRALIPMLRQSPGPDRDEAFVYNFTLSRTELRLKRLLNDNGRDQKIIAWLLAKHVLQAQYKNQALAGEVWAYTDEDGSIVVCLSGNSGTFKPEDERVTAAVEILGRMFQARVEVVTR